MRIFKKFLASLIPTPKTGQVTLFIDSADGKLTRKESNGTLTKYIPESGKLIYKALLSQAGTSAPTASIIENTVGTITYSIIGGGNYHVHSAAGLFAAGKTWPIIGSQGFNIVSVTRIDANTLQIYTYSTLFQNAQNGILSETSFCIEIYP